MLLGLVLPRVLKWVYTVWMSIAFALGFVMAHVILTLLFLLVITPMGLVARMTGKDFESETGSRGKKLLDSPASKAPDGGRLRAAVLNRFRP